MPDGHWRASNGAAIGPARTNGTAQPKPNGTAHSGGKVKMTLDADAKHDPQAIDQTAVSEEVSRPKVVDPEWGELTLEKAREKLVSHVIGVTVDPPSHLWFDCVHRGTRSSNSILTCTAAGTSPAQPALALVAVPAAVPPLFCLVLAPRLGARLGALLLSPKQPAVRRLAAPALPARPLEQAHLDRRRQVRD